MTSVEVMTENTSRCAFAEEAGVKPGDLIVTEGSFVLKSEFAKASLAEEE